VLLTFASLAGFLQLVAVGPAEPEPTTLEVGLVELPPAPAAAPAPAGAPPQPPPPSPPPARRVPLRASHPAAPREPQRPAEAEPGSAASATPAESAPREQAGPPAGAQPQAGRMSARALYRPLPEVPDELRHRNVELVALARFRVQPDGTAQVELIEPTSEPDLNQSLLATLRTWRFFPALQDGRPVASTLDIRIPVSVR